MRVFCGQRGVCALLRKTLGKAYGEPHCGHHRPVTVRVFVCGYDSARKVLTRAWEDTIDEIYGMVTIGAVCDRAGGDHQAYGAVPGSGAGRER